MTRLKWKRRQINKRQNGTTGWRNGKNWDLGLNRLSQSVGLSDQSRARKAEGSRGNWDFLKVGSDFSEPALKTAAVGKEETKKNTHKRTTTTL